MKCLHFQRGSGMPEFAIVSLAFFLLLFGILEFGRALYMYHTISNAARIGSRWAIVRGSASCSGPIDHCSAASADVQTYVQSQVPIVDSGSLAVTANWPGGNSTCTSTTDFKAKGCVVIVTVTYAFQGLPFITSGQINLSSTSQMPISQ